MKRKRTVLALITFLTAVLLATVSASAADYQITKKAGQYSLDVRFDRNPPIVGKNTVTATITDGAGKSVTDAVVTFNYSMPPMPGMPPMNYKTSAALKGQRYVATLDLSMSGSWNIVVRIAKGDQVQAARFTVDAK